MLLMAKSSTPVYEFGPFRLDAAEHLLMRDGLPVLVTPKAFDTLLVLVENNGHLVDKDALMAQVWPDSFVEEGSLTRNISVLRRLLGGDSADTRYIETTPKRGYRFTASVKQSEGEELVVRRRARVRIVTEEEDDEPAELELDALTKRLSLPEGIRSLAVLPFKVFGGNATDEYLGLGVADALITELSNSSRVTVRPTSAVLNYTGLTRDAASYGRLLHVDAVLEGSIQKLEDRMRVTVQLVGVEEDAPLWGKKFDAQFTHIFDAEDLISEQVLTALTSRLSGAESQHMVGRYQHG